MRAALYVGLFALAGPVARATPALITYGGNVVLGDFTTTRLEVGGTVRGSQYSALDVAGKLTFGGTLQLSLINSFAPAAGDSFNLFDWGTKAGAFSTLNLPALSPGLLWNQSGLYTTGSLSVGLDAAFTGRVWDGGGANNDWATDYNWDLNVEPLNNGTAALVFAGGVRLTPSVDTAWNVASMTFNNTAGAFTITGPQGVTVGAGGIVNNDADAQTITAALTLGANQTFNAAAGALSVGSVALGGRTLTVTGAAHTTVGSASGTGTVTKTGAGTLTVNGALGTGAVALNANAGAVQINASQTLAALTIGAGAEVTFGDGLNFAAPLEKSALPGVVPEPGAAALLLAGTFGVLALRRSGSARLSAR